MEGEREDTGAYFGGGKRRGLAFVARGAKELAVKKPPLQSSREEGKGYIRSFRRDG